MKVKHLFLAAVAAVFTFTACQEKLEDLGEPNIDLSTATLEFEQGASSQTITINATRAWKANDVADWIVVEPASGKASKEDQTVTITVLENTDMNRSCTIEFFAGIVSGYLTVNQAGPGGGVEEGDGSLEHPYLVSQANAIASALESGAEDGPYYIKGFVKKFASKHEDGVTNFGNALFYITDTKDGEGDDFYCYQVYYLGGKKFTSLDQIKEGDEVIVYGKITNYNGTCETVGKGAAYIYSLNGVIGDDGGNVDAVDATVTQVIEEQNTAVTYRLSGTVSRFNSQYCSFDLTDETGSIYVYSVTADTKEEYSTKLANGDTVTIEGEYQFYSKTSQHEIVNAKITKWSRGTDDGGTAGTPSGDGSLSSPYNATAARQAAAALAADTPTSEYYYIKGFVKKIASIDTGTYGNANFYITDTKEGNTEDFYCFQVMYLNGAKFTSSDQLKVGDEVVVYAQLINYKGNTPETVGKGSGKIISINGQGGDDGGQTGEVVEATVSQVMSEQNENVTYRLTGTVSGFNSQYCSFDITDATGKIYVYSVDAATKAEYSTKLANGDTVTIEGKYSYYAPKEQHEIVNAKITAWTKGTDDGGGQTGDVVDATVSQVTTEQNENVIYRLTGTVSGFNSQYCSFDLADATGKIYVYSVDSATKAEYSSKLANGDTVTIEGQYSYYAAKSQHEIINAKITAWTKGGDDGGQGGDGVDPSTLSQITCAEFNALSDSDNGYYILEGDVTTVENTQYGNLYIKDASGEEAYIYGLNGKNGEAFGTLNVAKGDKIKIYGQHTIYNNTTVEMKGAKLLSLTKGQGGDDSIGEAIFTLSFPDDNSASNKVNGYDKPWTAKSGSYSFTMTAFNNYEWKDWTYIRCGRKAASVASIATDNAISEAVSKVVIAIDKITASDINSISLIVAKDASFSNVVETVAVNAARGDVEAAISSPAAGLYYKLVFDCKASSENKNGFVQVSSLKFMK